LNEGEALSTVTQFLCERLGIRHPVAPMSDRSVRTIVHTDEGELEFQHYFVRRRCEPRVVKLEYRGADIAAPASAFDAALSRDDLEAVIICPSNLFLSIRPILVLGDIRAKIERQSAPVVAVSPIVGGQAIKGPAAKLFRELGGESSALEVARLFAGLIDGLVIDRVDAGFAPEIEKLGLRARVAETVMRNKRDQAELARATVQFAATLAH